MKTVLIYDCSNWWSLLGLEIEISSFWWTRVVACSKKLEVVIVTKIKHGPFWTPLCRPMRIKSWTKIVSVWSSSIKDFAEYSLSSKKTQILLNSKIRSWSLSSIQRTLKKTRQDFYLRLCTKLSLNSNDINRFKNKKLTVIISVRIQKVWLNRL